MSTRSLLLVVALLLLASAAGGQPPTPVLERVLPPGVRPVVPKPSLPNGLPVAPLAPPTAQDKQLAAHLEHLEQLHLRLKELEAKLTDEQRKAVGPFVVGRVLVVGFTPEEDQRVLSAVDKAGVRPGLTVTHMTVEDLRGRLASAGLRGEVTVLPADGESDRRDVRVRATPAILVVPPAK